MKIETRRFGTVEIDDLAIIVLPKGLIGLPLLTRFIALGHERAGCFSWWQSVDDRDTALVAVDPSSILPDYDLTGLEADLADLGLEDARACQVAVFATISGPRLDSVTLNLAAPVIVNPATRRGRQVVFQDGRYPVDARWDDLLSPKRSFELAA